MYIITGVAGGIGEYLFQTLSKEGHLVVGTYHHKIPQTQGKCYCVDLTDPQQIKDFVLDIPIATVHGEPINLIHCAGINKNGLTHKLPSDDWDTVLDVNLKSSFLICQNLLPIMRDREYGRIIFLSSVVPQLGVAGTPAYAASKAGLWGLAKTIAKENVTKNVTCNCLNLGYMDLGMTNTELPPDIHSKLMQSIPMKKFGDPVNILNAVKFLVNSDYVTGTSIDISGGLV